MFLLHPQKSTTETTSSSTILLSKQQHHHRRHHRRHRSLSLQILVVLRVLVTFLVFLNQVPHVSALAASPSKSKSKSIMVFFDFLKPYYYRIEKQVASNSIPDITGLSKPRQTLQEAATAGGAAGTAGTSFDHSLWDNVLKRHVVKDCTLGDVTGCHTVRYAALAKDADYWAYMELLQNVADPALLAPAEQLAFWINVYNAACIHLIVQHEKKCRETDPLYKLQSINKISDKEGPVWDKDAAVIAGKSVSLNYIEHEQLRKQWAEPAVHGCIVCASASCPNLRPEAFVVAKLKAQMEDQMQEWMTNESKGFKLNGNRLELSRIFLWFANDFGADWNGIRKYLTAYVPEQHQPKMASKGGITVRYFEYDWQINRAPPTK
jgi:hypothetical protein